MFNRVEWESTYYNQMTQTKGLFYKNINNTNLKFQHWFKNIVLKRNVKKITLN